MGKYGKATAGMEPYGLQTISQLCAKFKVLKMYLFNDWQIIFIILKSQSLLLAIISSC